MNLKCSTLKDVPDIMRIIKDAQNYLAGLRIDQWQDGYPNKEQIELDIKNNDSYVVLSDLGEIMITTVFTTRPEVTYQNIDGKWITDDNAKYGVIHRLAVREKYRKLGLAKLIFNKAEEKLKGLKISSMRVDTHKDNKGMQQLISKLGYKYCGIIYLENGDERFAYEKKL